MDESRFWSLIEAARLAANGDCDAMHDALCTRLLPLPLDEIVEFDKLFGQLQYQANRYDLQAAYLIMTGSGSYDGFIYFRSWLIGQGHERYYHALAQPDSLADIDLGDDDDAECEALAYVALHAYEEKTGAEMREYPIEHKEIEGHPLTEQELRERFPKLCEKYGWDMDMS
jgi:hypothetical protein